jgi:hypothetical protein
MQGTRERIASSNAAILSVRPPRAPAQLVCPRTVYNFVNGRKGPRGSSDVKTRAATGQFSTALVLQYHSIAPAGDGGSSDASPPFCCTGVAA